MTGNCTLMRAVNRQCMGKLWSTRNKIVHSFSWIMIIVGKLPYLPFYFFAPINPSLLFWEKIPFHPFFWWSLPLVEVINFNYNCLYQLLCQAINTPRQNNFQNSTLDISTTAIVWMFTLILNHKYANKKNPIIKA